MQSALWIYLERSEGILESTLFYKCPSPKRDPVCLKTLPIFKTLNHDFFHNMISLLGCVWEGNYSFNMELLITSNLESLLAVPNLAKEYYWGRLEPWVVSHIPPSSLAWSIGSHPTSAFCTLMLHTSTFYLPLHLCNHVHSYARYHSAWSLRPILPSIWAHRK